MEDGNKTPAGPPPPPAPGQAPPPPAWGYPPPPRPSNSTTLALIAHLGSFVGGFIVPLIIYLVAKDDQFVRRHAAEALNFQITCLAPILFIFVPFIAFPFAASGPEGMVVFFGLFVVVWLVAMAAGIGNIVFSIIAAVKASRYEEYRYPISIRFVKP